MSFTKFAALTIAIAFSVSSAFAATVEYRVLVDGQDIEAYTGAPGTLPIQVQVLVTDNDLAPVAPGNTGGVVGYDIQVPAAAGLQFEDLAGGFGGGDGKWDSDADSDFGTHNQGLVNVNSGGTDYALFAEGGLGNPGDFGNPSLALKFGAGQFTTVVSGNIIWDGTPTTLLLEPTGADSTTISAVVGSGIAGANPDIVLGDSVTFGAAAIPEPASIALLGLVAVAGLRRRR